MKTIQNNDDRWLWLTLPIAGLLAIAAACGLFVPTLYRDTANLVAQARGQDVITLVVALPTLVLSAIRTWGGSHRARLIWLGAILYIVYTYVGYAFAVRFNQLFLVYVALVGCATYALIGGLVTMPWTRLTAGFTQRTPVKTVSLYLGVIVVLFYGVWLSEALPASLSGTLPQTVSDAGTPTNFVHVLDMAWVLPATAIAAVSLWRKRPLGYVLAGVVLAFLVLLTLAILAMIVVLSRAGHPLVVPQVGLYLVLSALSSGMLIGYLIHLRSGAEDPAAAVGPQAPGAAGAPAV